MNDDAGTLGQILMARLEELACDTEPGPGVTRIFASPEHQRAADRLGGWMRDAGMSWSIDPIGNIVGRYPANHADAKTLIMGSHHDSVRQGGKFDGPLGVLLPIACVAMLHEQGRRLPFHIEVVAFCDEEGVRFGTTLLGSKAFAGQFDHSALDMLDRDGVSMRDALTTFGGDPDAIDTIARDPKTLLGYIEAHIEQGPVLETLDLPVGVVSGISHGVRLSVSITGEAGHAGTVPMTTRRDALCAASDAVLAIEQLATEMGDGAVGTVGTLEVDAGAINVIPGSVRFSADLRSPTEQGLTRLQSGVRSALDRIGRKRKAAIAIEQIYAAAGCPMSEGLTACLADAVAAQGLDVHILPSGAGHDAMAMAGICDVGMLFVRCAGGISHNPAESVIAHDLGVAALVLMSVLDRIDPTASR